MKLWLIGMMGSGKTTAGRATAERLGEWFIDTDETVEELAGTSISRLWEEHGEAAFRSLETKAVAELAATEDAAVIGTGGGVPLDPMNRHAMNESGTVVWLRAAPEVLSSRIGSSGRPLLAGQADPEGALRELLAERSSLYAEAADIEIDVDRLELSDVVDRLVDLWSR